LAARIIVAVVSRIAAGRDRTAAVCSDPSCLEQSSSRPLNRQRLHVAYMEEDTMDGLIYLVGLIVIILAILSFFGLR